MSRSRSAWKIPYVHPGLFSDGLRTRRISMFEKDKV